MTTPQTMGNGIANARKVSVVQQAKQGEPEAYHGLPVLRMHVSDPVPTPPVPTRYVVHVHPDLARYLLTFNHEKNRNRKPRKVRQYAEVMRHGLWRLAPQGPVFSREGILINGQNTLMAVTEYGGAVALVVDFGWPIETIYVLDHGGARTASDSLHISDAPNPTTLAAAITRWWQYQKLAGGRKGMSGFDVPSSEVIRELAEQSPDTWDEAASVGKMTYRRLDKGWSPATWAAAYAILVSGSRDHAAVREFFEEVGLGTGLVRSASRVLGDWARRRPVSQTRSGDSREPLELIIRAFNAWRAGKTYAGVTQAGFVLSRVK